MKIKLSTLAMSTLLMFGLSGCGESEHVGIYECAKIMKLNLKSNNEFKLYMHNQLSSIGTWKDLGDGDGLSLMTDGGESIGMPIMDGEFMLMSMHPCVKIDEK